ncbi:hypothetical protein [Halopiger aswanensis]|uniref:Uncharacterized protein n=1 Tax=Halopiger aswanensis TaxID=148449 RepID=A0A3R7HGY8_9EURY|nr:hypothetical protein [Halopiger aswanensis]RKD93394.1 hypothetical protein ATJ93_3018 [Halopiger aswanensis]
MSNDEEVWLRYGTTATPVDEPDRTFGYVNSSERRFGTFPTEFISVVDVGLYEEEGKILLSAVEDRLYRRFANGFEETEFADLLDVLRERTLLTEPEMRVFVLYGWFDMDAERAAEPLGCSAADVEAYVEAIRDKRNRAEATAAIPFVRE